MKKKILIIGGTGQFGICLGNILVKKNYQVLITSRYNKKINFYKKVYPKLNFLKLDLNKKKEIKKILNIKKILIIFYFASQSSPQKSFRLKRETLKSNYEGCKHVLDIILKKNLKIKFVNAASSEMYGHIKNKIDLKTPKNPLNPYGEAKKKSFNLVKKYRQKFNMPNYNAIMFNTESYLRDKDFIIAKICIGAIKAFKYQENLTLNNTLVTREWNWCNEQCHLLLKFLNKEPQDFILSNGKYFSLKQMLNFAFGYFNLDYKIFVKTKLKRLKKSEVKVKKSNYKKYLKINNINFESKIFGKKLIYKMINYYLRKNII